MLIRRLESFDDAVARLWYGAFRAGASAGRHAPLVTSEEKQLGSLASNATNPNRRREAWGAWEGADCLGTLLVEMPLQENAHLAEVEVDVPPAHRGRGVGAALWAYGRDRVRAAGRKSLIVEVNVPAGVPLESSPGGRFALARGYIAGLAETRYVLDLPAPSFPAAASAYQTRSWIGIMPDGWLDGLGVLLGEMSGEVPSGELGVGPARWDAARVAAHQRRMTELGYGLVTTVAFDRSGRPAGYTQMLVADEDVHQDDTYVREADRGNGLGHRLKAANLRALADGHPHARHVHTWTADTNDSMRRINERFGFRPVEATYTMEAVA